MAQVIVRDERRGLRRRRVAELSYSRVGGLEECAAGVEDLGDLSVDLKPDRARGDVSENRAEMHVQTGALTGRHLDLLYLDQAVRQLGGQEMPACDRRHAEY